MGAVVDTRSKRKVETMKTSTAFAVLAFLGSYVQAQEISLGECPNFPVEQNFDPQRYLGRWYEYSNYFAIFQLFGVCVSADYSDVSSGGQTKIKVINKGVNTFKGTPNVAEGSAVLGEPANPSKPGKLIVNFDSQPSFARSSTTNYNILDTDYSSYAIVYSCSEKLLVFKTELLWILTRDRNPTQSVIDKATAIIKSQG